MELELVDVHVKSFQKMSFLSLKNVTDIICFQHLIQKYSHYDGMPLWILDKSDSKVYSNCII